MTAPPRSIAAGSAPGMLLIAAATVASSILGFALGWRWALPVLNAVPAYTIILSCLQPGRRGRTIGLLIWWAFWLAVAGVTLTILWPEAAASVTLNGAEYREEMRAWLTAGVGRESTPAEFIPQHLLHAAVFCVMSLLTASTVSLIMGAVLMNYMSFYVGDLILQCSGSPLLARAILLAWNPWSMVRVVSFITLGVILAEPLLSRIRRRTAAGRGRLVWIGAATAGLVLDVFLKSLLAPKWPGLIGGCLG